MYTWQPRARWIVRTVLVLLIIAAVTLLVWAHQRQQPEYLAARAREAVAAGDDEKAEIYLSNLIRKTPEDADAKMALADVFVRRAHRAGKPESYAVDGRAMQLLAAAAAQKPADLPLQAKLMTAYLEGGRDEAALNVARQLVRAEVPSETALYLVARKAVSGGNYREAEEPLARLTALQADPPLRVLVLQAHLCGQQRDNAWLGQLLERVQQKVTAAAAEIAKLPPPDRQALHAILALGILRADGPEQAHRRTEQALALFEKMSQAEDAKGKAAMVETAGKLVVLLAEAHPLRPPQPPALVEQRQRLVTRFAAWARPLVAGQETAPLVYHLLAEGERVQGNDSAAIKTLEEGLTQGAKLPAERAKELAPLHLLAAQCLVAQRRFADAEPHWKWLLKDPATAAWGHRLAGAIALEDGRLEEAANHFAAGLPGFDQEIELHAALAATCLRLGRWAQAVEQLQVILARKNRLNDSERATVARFLTSMEKVPALLGSAQLALGHYREVPPLVEMLTASEQEPAALGLLVAYHRARGEDDEATRRLNEARAKYPDDLDLALQEVRMLKTRSDDREAIARLQPFAQEGRQHLAVGAMLAQWWIANGDRDAALSLVDDMAKRFPDDPGVKLLQADVRLAAGKADEAQPLLDQLRQGGAPREAVNLLQARAALMSHRLDDATAALAETSDPLQQSGLYSLWRGRLAGAQGDFQRAAAEFAASFRVSSLRPAAREGLVQALTMLMLQQDLATVETKLNELLADSPNEPLLLLVAAELALRQGRFERVMPLLDKAEKLQPNLLLVVHAKARAWLQQGRADHALNEVERALRANPDDVPTRLLAAEVQLARNDPQAALLHVEKVLADDPRLADAQLLRAEIFRRLKRWDEAVSQLEDLLGRQPDAFFAYLLLAEIYQSQGNGAKALEVLRSAGQRFPGQPTLCTQEIGVLCGLQRVAEAEDVARKLAGQKPDADLCLTLGTAFLGAHELSPARGWAQQALAAGRAGDVSLRAGDESRQTAARLLLANVSLVEGRRTKDKAKLTESRDYYRQVFQAQPANLLAANNLAWLLAAEFGEPDKAREVVDRALGKTSLKKLPPGVADTFAMVYRQTGQLDAAQQIVEEALRRTPDHAVLNFQAGLVYGQKQRLGPARSALQKAIDLGLPAEQAAEASAELQRLEAAAEKLQPRQAERAAENETAPSAP